MHFQLAPHRRGLHLIRNSKIKVNFILRLHLHLTSLNCKQNLSVEDMKSHDIPPFSLRFSSKATNYPTKIKKTHTHTKIFHPKIFTATLDIPVADILSHHQNQKSKTATITQEQCGHNTQSKCRGLHIPQRL